MKMRFAHGLGTYVNLILRADIWCGGPSGLERGGSPYPAFLPFRNSTKPGQRGGGYL